MLLRPGRALALFLAASVGVHAIGVAAGETAESECDARFILQVNEDGEDAQVPLSSYPKKQWKTMDGLQQDIYVINAEKSVYYVPNFLNKESPLIEELASFCETQQRFVPSPQRQTDGAMSKDDKRTSESCPMVPSGTYLTNPQYQEMAANYNNKDDSEKKEMQQQPLYALMREVNVTWEITQQAASLPIADSAISPYHVEPLQLVRYLGAGAAYKTHHDHGSFYGNENSEQRPFTILVYLNQVEGGGGATYFPKLGLRFLPVPGDAIVWSNTKADDKRGGFVVDPDMVHAGEPPASDEGNKYALNIWIGQAAFDIDNAKQAKWT